jgi:hypothetical protein
MTDQQQPSQPGAATKPPSYQNTSSEIFPLPFFITRGEPYIAEPGEQTEPVQQAPEPGQDTES